MCVSNIAVAYEKIGEIPVEFSADRLVYDEENQTVLATGDVELINGLQILRAEKISYNLAEDKVEAFGDVSLLDEKGNVIFADQLQLKHNMKEGFIKELLAILSDGSRITASFSKSENNGNLLSMKDASYTVCETCEANPSPMWQIKASKVEVDKEEQEVRYKNARLELMGVPIFYTPYFSHPDPTLERKSGFLRPNYGWSDNLGIHMGVNYYYDIAPNRDATLNIMPTNLAGILLGAEYRERFVKGEMQLEGSFVKSDRKEYDGSISRDKTRGHVELISLFNVNEEWRGGIDFTRSSDRQYLRLYNMSDEDVITNEIYAERFSGRDYAKISLLNFQDLRLGINEDQPDILPHARYNFVGEPDSFFGGRFAADMSLMVLNRDNNEQDMQRTSFKGEWQRIDTTSFGLVNTYQVSANTDFYAIQNSDAAKLDPTLDNNTLQYRAMATAGIVSSYPLVRPVFDNKARAIIEPIVGLNFSPKENRTRQIEIPNEDSIDVRFDSNNLFDLNRFSGIDMQEDGGRLDLGVKTSLYDLDGNYGKFFIGQSYRFYGDTLYPKGSGLEDNLSDFVGQLKIGFNNILDADYRFQFDNKTLAARRHEIQASTNLYPMQLGVRYIYVDSVAGTGFDEAREQIYFENIYHLNQKWHLTSSALADIGDEPGFRNASLGLIFTDDCFTFNFKGKRNIASDASGKDETRFMFRIGLKNIGEMPDNHFSLGGFN